MIKNTKKSTKMLIIDKILLT